MMTKKTMTILSVFMIVALTAVGFAAWLIVGTIDAETTGSFVSNELQDKYFKVEVEFAKANADDKNGQIIFGAPDGDSAGKWLTYKNTDAKENLSAVATIKFTPDGGFDLGTETMEYYLEDAAGNQRTIRVAIDIAELFDAETGNQTSDFYKWFDMAVELGYIQYPTAKLVGSDKVLAWAADEDKSIGDYNKFENGYLYLDLGASDFVVDTTADSETYNKIATAKIQIDFAWGEALKTTVADDPETDDVDESKTIFNNPYKYFNDLEPEDPATVLKYLDVEAGELKATVANAQDATKPGVEGYDLYNAQTIRKKDLAQRLLDYLYNHLNYEAAVYDGDEVETQQKGIQFSITLSEGEVIPKA